MSEAYLVSTGDAYTFMAIDEIVPGDHVWIRGELSWLAVNKVFKDINGDYWVEANADSCVVQYKVPNAEFIAVLV